MSEQLIQLLMKQMDQQKNHMDQQKEQMDLQKEQMEEQRKSAERRKEQMKDQHKAETEAMLQLIRNANPAEAVIADQRQLPVSTSANPSFAASDASSELWTDYYSRFCTFLAANAEPKPRKAQVFLTKQNVTIYRQLSTLASQMTEPKDINDLTMDEILEFMKD